MKIEVNCLDTTNNRSVTIKIENDSLTPRDIPRLTHFMRRLAEDALEPDEVMAMEQYFRHLPGVDIHSYVDGLKVQGKDPL